MFHFGDSFRGYTLNCSYEAWTAIHDPESIAKRFYVCTDEQPTLNELPSASPHIMLNWRFYGVERIRRCKGTKKIWSCIRSCIQICIFFKFGFTTKLRATHAGCWMALKKRKNELNVAVMADCYYTLVVMQFGPVPDRNTFCPNS